MRDMIIQKLRKRSDRIGSAKLIILALLAGTMVFTVSASAQPESAGVTLRCSVATLKGQYSHMKNAFNKITDPKDPNKTITIPFASIALYTFDGQGNFNGVADVVFDGVMWGENIPVSDTYTVNPDCAGTLGSMGPLFDILVVRDGSSFLIIEKIPGATGASEAKRIKLSQQ
jgi:hypothetical protein